MEMSLQLVLVPEAVHCAHAGSFPAVPAGWGGPGGSRCVTSWTYCDFCALQEHDSHHYLRKQQRKALWQNSFEDHSSTACATKDTLQQFESLGVPCMCRLWGHCASDAHMSSLLPLVEPLWNMCVSENGKNITRIARVGEWEVQGKVALWGEGNHQTSGCSWAGSWRTASWWCASPFLSEGIHDGELHLCENILPLLDKKHWRKCLKLLYLTYAMVWQSRQMCVTNWPTVGMSACGWSETKGFNVLEKNPQVCRWWIG